MSETYRVPSRRCFENQAEYEAVQSPPRQGGGAAGGPGGLRTGPSISASIQAPPRSKVAVIDENAELLFTDYRPNQGDPMPC